MPKLGNRLPKYRTRPDGRALVVIDGRHIYLRMANTATSRREYDRVIAEWLASGRHQPQGQAVPSTPDITVNELLLEYLHHCEVFYGPAGSEVEKVRLAIRPARQLYGKTPAIAFGPKKLKTVRQNMIDSGLCVVTINQRLQRLVRAFKYGVAEEMIPATVHEALTKVEGLRKKNAPGVKESRKVKPVADEHVDAIRPHVSRQIWAVVQVLRLTGARASEILSMRTGDIETSGPVWLYTPARHKTQRHGKLRQIAIGSRGQEVLRPWLRPDPTEFLFQPQEAMEEHHAERRKGRPTPCVGPNASDPVTAGADEEGQSAKEPRRAVRRARAAPRRLPRLRPGWHPAQAPPSTASHSSNTAPQGASLDAARAVLGHSSCAVTDIYAELDINKAVEAMERVG